MSSIESSGKKDWSATQYLKFASERTRPVYDLISQVSPHMTSSSPRIFDLGCGPGNSTEALLSTFPDAKVTGMDSSPDMLKKARATLPSIEFVQGDVHTYQPEDDANILFSNAVFHWLRSEKRIPTIQRFFESLNSGGVLAFQVPDNYQAPSHTLMRTTATLSNSAWSPYFSNARIGDLSNTSRPDLDPIEEPGQWYAALQPLSSSVNIWRTEYFHILKDAGAIVEWVKGTGLQPYLNMIADEEAKQAFLKEYERRLSEAYPAVGDERKVVLGYPRLFLVAVRK